MEHTFKTNETRTEQTIWKSYLSTEYQLKLYKVPAEPYVDISHITLNHTTDPNVLTQSPPNGRGCSILLFQQYPSQATQHPVCK